MGVFDALHKLTKAREKIKLSEIADCYGIWLSLAVMGIQKTKKYKN